MWWPMIRKVCRRRGAIKAIADAEFAPSALSRAVNDAESANHSYAEHIMSLRTWIYAVLERQVMRDANYFFDGRNLLNPETMRQFGFGYYSYGTRQREAAVTKTWRRALLRETALAALRLWLKSKMFRRLHYPQVSLPRGKPRSIRSCVCFGAFLWRLAQLNAARFLDRSRPKFAHRDHRTGHSHGFGLIKLFLTQNAQARSPRMKRLWR